MNYEEILARIQGGENAEDIVKEFTDNINKAQAEIEAAKKEDAKSKRLDEIAFAISHALNEYMLVAGFEDTEKLCAADVRVMLDEFLPVIDLVKDIKVKVVQKPMTKLAKKPNKNYNIDDVFADFFKSMGI